MTGMGQNMKERKSAYGFVGLLLFLQAMRDSLRAGFFNLCLGV